MSPTAALQATGTLLYGPGWRRPLARALRRPDADHTGIDERLLHHWLAETPGRPVPGWIPGALAELLLAETADRVAAVGDLVGQITDLVEDETEPDFPDEWQTV